METQEYQNVNVVGRICLKITLVRRVFQIIRTIDMLITLETPSTIHSNTFAIPVKLAKDFKRFFDNLRVFFFLVHCTLSPTVTYLTGQMNFFLQSDDQVALS